MGSFCFDAHFAITNDFSLIDNVSTNYPIRVLNVANTITKQLFKCFSNTSANSNIDTGDERWYYYKIKVANKVKQTKQHIRLTIVNKTICSKKAF